MRIASTPARCLGAALLALLLALRVLASTGLMPAIGHGRVTIIACPDADQNAPFAIGAAHDHHHHGKDRHRHSLCPYAAASSLSLVNGDLAPLLALAALIGAALLAMGIQTRAASRPRRLRPPLRGPPLLG